MRACLLSICLSMAVLLPKTGSAQAFAVRTPAPDVTAVAADWQINSDPIVVAGAHGWWRSLGGFVLLAVAVVALTVSLPRRS